MDFATIQSTLVTSWLGAKRRGRQVFPRDCPRPRAADFQGMAGDIVPDANAEFQHVTDLKQDLFEW